MTNDHPFHPDYIRALISGNTTVLNKLIRHALDAEYQKEFFTGDKTGTPLTPFEELATAVWRTFENRQIDHAQLFLDAHLPVGVLLPDVDAITHRVLYTPLDITILAGTARGSGQLQLVKMLLAAGADPQRSIWENSDPTAICAGHVKSIAVARAFLGYGVPAEAFVKLPPHLLWRLKREQCR